MADEYLTAEEFTAKHGIDLNTIDPSRIVDNTPKSVLPSAGDALRDVAVGPATLLTDFAQLPSVAYAAGKSLYSTYGTDKSFTEDFAKNLRIEDAPQQTEALLKQRVGEWRTQQPDLTDDDVKDLLGQYTKTKEFERFNKELLNPVPRFAAQWKDTVRDTLGDTRKDSERSWVDGALEIVGGSGVGVGPKSAAKLGESFASTAVGNAVLSNSLSKGALRVAEAATPITLPLTPGNFALNAIVGVTLDQGLRYATGDDTAFTANDGNLGGVAEVAAATGAGIAVIAALRGRAARIAEAAAQKTVAATAKSGFPTTPEIGKALEGASENGAALIAGKQLDEFATAAPKPALDGIGGRYTNTVGAFADEFKPVYDLIKDVYGTEVARQLEGDFSNLTGAGGRDTAHARATAVLDPVTEQFEKLDPALREQANAGWIASVAEDRNVQIETKYQNRIDELAALQKDGKITTDQAKEFATLDTELKLFKSDAPEARRFIPEIPRAQVQGLKEWWESNPALAGVRDAIERGADKVMDNGVRAGLFTNTERNDLRNTARYYVPLQQDPLEGASGWSRVIKAFLADLPGTSDKTRLAVQDANRNVLRTFDKTIITDADRARVTRPMDPMLAFTTYSRAMYHDIQQNELRAKLIHALEYDTQGNISKYLLDNNIQRKGLNNRNEWSSEEIRAAQAGVNNLEALSRWASDPNIIRTRVNGMTRFYEFGDPAVAQLLRLEPKLYTGWTQLWKYVSDTFKFNTTGYGAPAFSVINSAYDTMMGSATRRAERAFGPLTYVIHRTMSEQVAKHLGGKIFDYSAFAALPAYAVATMFETTAVHAARYLARDLVHDGNIAAFAKAVGAKNYDKAVESMLLASSRSTTMLMHDNGIMHNAAISRLPEATNAFSYVQEKLVPAPMRASWQFYRDIINSIHSTPKYQFFSQNYDLLERKFGKGQIPEKEMSKLIAETRDIAGNMTRQAGSAMVNRMEQGVPYMAPMRNGLAHLYRNLSDKETAQHVWPRLVMGMTGVMSSFYLMSNWDDKAKEKFWIHTPEWQRYRYLFIPTAETVKAWYNGEKPEYSDDKVYKFPIGPDLAPVIAGTSAFLRAMGALPNGPADTATTGGADLKKMMLDMITPVMPPLLQAGMAMFGARVDLQEGVQGGHGIKLLNANTFQRGPQTEGATNLGEMNTVTSQLLGTLFGANGGYLAKSIDAFNHAAKFDQTKAAQNSGLAPARPAPNYVEGLKAATTTYVDQSAHRWPDVPLLWKGDNKNYVVTTASSAVSEGKTSIDSIAGIRDNAEGARGVQKRGAATDAGGIAVRYLRDPDLLGVAADVRKWNNSGDYAQLKKDYGTLAATRRGVDANYAMPKVDRLKRVNEVVDQMQDNMNQQRLAIMHKEQEIAEQYGPVLQSKGLSGPVSMQAIDQLLRKSIASGK